LLNGGRLLSIVYNNVKIIDSYNFIPLALSKCPETFGLNELRKGYFQYLFNTSVNQNRILQSHPTEDMYGVKYMTSNNRNDFLKWYEMNKNKIFDLNQ
jgi:hypothetical protein